jgi:psiF repeat
MRHRQLSVELLRHTSKGDDAMIRNMLALALVTIMAVPAGAQITSQQQRMKDCNAQASGMTGDARKQFMSSCLSGGETKGPHCTKGKPCGDACIAVNKVCHKS